MRTVLITLFFALSVTMTAAQPQEQTSGPVHPAPHADSRAVPAAGFQAARYADSPAACVESHTSRHTDSRIVPRRFSGAVSVGVGIALNQPASTPVGWQAVGYYNPCVRFAVGAGVGMSFYEKTLIPLFADVKYLLTRPRRFTPYLECGAGYAFASSRQANGGLYLNPSVGVQYAFRSGLKLFFAAGYELQGMERLKSHANPWFAAEFSERLRHNSLSLRLGCLF